MSSCLLKRVWLSVWRHLFWTNKARLKLPTEVSCGQKFGIKHHLVQPDVVFLLWKQSSESFDCCWLVIFSILQNLIKIFLLLRGRLLDIEGGGPGRILKWINSSSKVVKKIFAPKLHVYYIDSGWLGDQYCLLLAETVILVEAVGRDQY